MNRGNGFRGDRFRLYRFVQWMPGIMGEDRLRA